MRATRDAEDKNVLTVRVLTVCADEIAGREILHRHRTALEVVPRRESSTFDQLLLLVILHSQTYRLVG